MHIFQYSTVCHYNVNRAFLLHKILSCDLNDLKIFFLLYSAQQVTMVTLITVFRNCCM